MRGEDDVNELETLLASMSEGGLDDEKRGRLARLLQADPEARRLYLDHCQMLALLRSAHGELTALAPAAQRVRRPWGAVAAAAVLVAVSAVAFLALQRSTRLDLRIDGEARIVREGRLIRDGELLDGDRVFGQGARFAAMRLDGEAEVRRDRVRLREGVLRGETALLLETPHAEAAGRGAFELWAAGGASGLKVRDGGRSMAGPAGRAEAGPGELLTADGQEVVRWTPVCAIDFEKESVLPPPLEAVFCGSRTVHTKDRRVVSAPERALLVPGGLRLSGDHDGPGGHGLAVLRWKEEVGDDIVLEADLAAGERWSLGMALSGDSFEGLRVIFAVPEYPGGISVDVIHPAQVMLAQDPRPIPFGAEHTLRVERRGSLLRVWVDGGLRLDTEVRHPLPDGRKRVFALSNYGNPPVIKALRAWKPAP